MIITITSPRNSRNNIRERFLSFLLPALSFRDYLLMSVKEVAQWKSLSQTTMPESLVEKIKCLPGKWSPRVPAAKLCWKSCSWCREISLWKAGSESHDRNSRWSRRVRNMCLRRKREGKGVKWWERLFTIRFESFWQSLRSTTRNPFSSFRRQRQMRRS